MLAPIISVVGHVDVGKTSFLDYYSKNKTKEVNGITQTMVGTLKNLKLMLL